MPETYFLADPHFFGKNVIRFSRRLWVLTAEEREQFDHDGTVGHDAGDRMNRLIVRQINQKVKPADRLFMLGDVVFAGTAKQARKRTQWFLDSLLCKQVYIVWGNHDCTLSGPGGSLDDLVPQDRENYRDAIQSLYSGSWDACMVYCESGIQVWCSHYPHVTWPRATKTGQPGKANPGKTQSIHCYGHVHERYNDEKPVRYPERWAAANCGVDALNGQYGWPMSATELWSFTEPQRKEMCRLVNEGADLH